MFKEILLATTALLAVASITPVEARSAGSVNADMASAMAHRGQDKNTEFLCTYGGYKVSSYDFSSANRSPSEYRSGWKDVAVPIKGHGRPVDKIIVQDGEISGSSYFNAAIYGNNKGKPGSPITGGSAYANANCDKITVTIPATVLEKGKKYWVVESASSRFGEVSWAVDPVARDDAYSKYYRDDSGSSYTSPWKHIAGRAPFVRVK